MKFKPKNFEIDLIGSEEISDEEWQNALQQEQIQEIARRNRHANQWIATLLFTGFALTLLWLQPWRQIDESSVNAIEISATSSVNLPENRAFTADLNKSAKSCNHLCKCAQLVNQSNGLIYLTQQERETLCAQTACNTLEMNPAEQHRSQLPPSYEFPETGNRCL